MSSGTVSHFNNNAVFDSYVVMALVLVHDLHGSWAEPGYCQITVLAGSEELNHATGIQAVCVCVSLPDVPGCGEVWVEKQQSAGDVQQSCRRDRA